MNLEGKISVTHFLKKNLKPLIEGRTEKYPLYVRIRLDNKKTEIKSRYKEFIGGEEERLDRLISEANSDDSLSYLSDKEFSKIHDDYRLLNELKIISSIADFYRRHGINIVETDPSSAIVRSSRHIKNILFVTITEELKYELMMNDKYVLLRRIINWDYTNIVEVYRALKDIVPVGSPFYKAFLSKYDVLLPGLRQDYEFENYPALIYQWENPILKKEILSHFNDSNNKIKITKILDSYFNELIPKK